MPLERVFSSPTEVYTSRWLAIQKYAETHPRITGGPEKIGQRVTAVVLEEFQSVVKGTLNRDKEFQKEHLPIQEYHTDQEVIKKFWGTQGLADLKRDFIEIEPVEQPQAQKKAVMSSSNAPERKPASPPSSSVASSARGQRFPVKAQSQPERSVSPKKGGRRDLYRSAWGDDGAQ